MVVISDIVCAAEKTYWWLPVAIITPIVIALAAATFCIIMHLRKGSKTRQRRPRRHTGMHYHAENRGYAGGPEGAVYPIVNPGVPGAMGAMGGMGGEKKGELPPEFLQLPPYMNDPPPEYTEIVGGGSGLAAGVGYAPSQASRQDDTRSVMSGKSAKSHKSHKSDKSSHRSRADDLQSVKSDGGRSSASTAYPQSARPHQYNSAGYQPTDGGFM